MAVGGNAEAQHGSGAASRHPASKGDERVNVTTAITSLGERIGRCDKGASNRARQTQRVRAWWDAMADERQVEDAALWLEDDVTARLYRLGRIVAGDAARAAREYGFTPVIDLRTARTIRVVDRVNPSRGSASTGMEISIYRDVSGKYVTGDFRHELGHVVFFDARAELRGGVLLVAHVTEAFNAARAKLPLVPPGASEAELLADFGIPSARALDSVDEFAAEHYRVYHRELLRQRKRNGNYLANYRAACPAMAKLWDARYTVALAQQRGLL
jgi:hypothetical protein